MDISWSTVYLLLDWIIRISALIYIPQQRSPNAARAWLLFIFFFPLIGIIIYGWVGRIYLPQRRLNLMNEAAQQIIAAGKQLITYQPHIHKTYYSEDPFLQKQIDTIKTLTGFPAVDNSHIEVLFGYEKLIERLLGDIQAAQTSIHMLYYIYGNDEIAQKVTDALCDAAKRGVHVRLLADSVGSYKGLKHQAPQLRAAGIEVQAALPVGLFRIRAARMDLRNHRKITVIDGYIAHVGSQNIVSPDFVPGLPNEELNLRITGLLACELQAIFLADWYVETHTPLPIEQTAELFSPQHLPQHLKKHAGQALPSGPGYGGGVIRDVMISLIYTAEKEIRISSPYFVPDEPFLTALLSASQRGVKVELIFPKTSNHGITNLVQESYYTQLLHAGIHIYRYKTSMLHAKFMVFDQKIGFVGSLNLDVRSFILNAEVVVAIYDTCVVGQLHGIQDRLIKESDKVNLEMWKNRPKWKKIMANLARLVDALL